MEADVMESRRYQVKCDRDEAAGVKRNDDSRRVNTALYSSQDYDISWG